MSIVALKLKFYKTKSLNLNAFIFLFNGALIEIERHLEINKIAIMAKFMRVALLTSAFLFYNRDYSLGQKLLQLPVLNLYTFL